MAEVHDLVTELEKATGRLIATLDGLPPERVSDPTQLPNWTRGHVLTHIARNADGFRNFLLGARAKRPVAMYSSKVARDADIVAGATRPGEVIIADATRCSLALLIDVQTTPSELWSQKSVYARRSNEGPMIEVASFLPIRLSELEIHHVDVGWNYSFQQSTSTVLQIIIARYLAQISKRDALAFSCRILENENIDFVGNKRGPVVSGSAADIAGWLTRRSDGATLIVSPRGPLPEVPKI